MPQSSQTPSRRDELILMLLHGGASSSAIAEQVVDMFAAEVRDEIADDLHRAELPTFAADENPVLVTKTVRAIDVRLADRGSTAPYYVAKGGRR